jgi:hypothetical protein
MTYVLIRRRVRGRAGAEPSAPQASAEGDSVADMPRALAARQEAPLAPVDPHDRSGPNPDTAGGCDCVLLAVGLLPLAAATLKTTPPPTP